MAGWPPLAASALAIWSLSAAICWVVLLTLLTCVCTWVLTWFDRDAICPEIALKRVCRVLAALRKTWRALVLDGLEARLSAALKKLVSAEPRPLLLSDR